MTDRSNRKSLARPIRIVSLGGGNGLSTLLRGLKRYALATEGALEITAVVAVSDDGGSSGRLRREFDVLPPGDIRNCMVALSSDEALLGRLFQYRFASGRGLKGHSFGNLFLTAMTHLTGDFADAVRLSSEVLAVRGRIFPATRSNVVLEATLAGGDVVYGETQISRTAHISKVALKPAGARPLPEVIDAIEKADLITFGPGSLFTSVLPNLLLKGVPRAIAESKATKVFFLNLMSQPGETTGLMASDHLRVVQSHCGRFGKKLVDVVVVNTRAVSGSVAREYGKKLAQPVDVDQAVLESLGARVIGADLLRMASGKATPRKIRHDPATLAAVALELAQEHRRQHR